MCLRGLGPPNSWLCATTPSPRPRPQEASVHLLTRAAAELVLGSELRVVSCGTALMLPAGRRGQLGC